MNMIDNKLNPYRVLIVDDNPAVRELLSAMLQSPQRAIEVRDTSRAAMDLLEHQSVDLAFIGLSLPGVAGTKLAEKIQKRCPHAHVVIFAGQMAEGSSAAAHARNAEKKPRKRENLGDLLQLADSCSTE
jgi:CheY-like chemotaxis protein